MKKTPELPEWRYTHCAVSGCGREVRAFSRYCTQHARIHYRTRDVNGRVIRRRELAPYALRSDEFLSRHASHPATLAAEDYMRATLTAPNLPPKLKREMERLRTQGASARECLVAVLSVFGLMLSHPNSVTNGACESMNLGRHLLQVRPRFKRTSRTGKTYHSHLPGTLCETLGDQLRADLSRYAAVFWRVVREREEGPKRTAATLRAALDIPFDPDK